ncbi:hypothetical protein GF343_05145 [Candidatus Woesearchaeota archaeon]|nr:hypothetical protein [Candidatus Woesearchaeota archaeon]
MIAQYVLGYFLLAWEIFIRPWQHAETLWIILPLIIVLVLIHVYFGRYPTEQIGWSTAFANSISLLWVCVLLIKFLFSKYSFTEMYTVPSAIEAGIVVIILIASVLLLLLLNFYHALPKGIMRVFSGFEFDYILAYIAISLIILFDINRHLLIAAALLFIIMFFLTQLLKRLVPKSEQAKRIQAMRRKHEKRVKAGEKAARTKKWNRLKEKLRSLVPW